MSGPLCSQFLRAVCVPELGHTQRSCGILSKTTKKIEVGVTFRAASLPSVNSISMSFLRRHPVSQCGPAAPFALLINCLTPAHKWGQLSAFHLTAELLSQTALKASLTELRYRPCFSGLFVPRGCGLFCLGFGCTFCPLLHDG
jgi:hypothetical protein